MSSLASPQIVAEWLKKADEDFGFAGARLSIT